MKRKLALQDIKLQSFITCMAPETRRIAQGGAPPATRNLVQCQSQSPPYCNEQTRDLILCTGL